MPPAIDKDAKIPCASPQQLQSELDALSNILELGEREDTWEKMERALLRFAGITRGGGYKHLPLYTDGIGRSGMGLAITACMLSDRGRLSGVATDLLQTLAPRLGHSFAPLVSVYMPVLVTLLGRPNKVFLKRAEKCVSTIITHCPLPNILIELRRGLTDEAATCRRGCSAGLLRALDEWPAEVFGQKGVTVIEEALRKVGTDKDPEVRSTGKKIYVRYCDIWPERIEDFADPLTPTIRRYLGVGASTGTAPAKPARRPAPMSKPPAPLPSAPHEPHAVSHHRVQALGGPAVRPTQTAQITAPARRSPQKATVPLAGPSRPAAPIEHESEPAPARTRVRSGRYPEALAVQPAIASKVNIFAAPENAKPPHPVGYGRSASHTVLPTGSMISPEPVRPPSSNGLGHAFRPVIATSASTISLPTIPPTSTDTHEPVRRFAAPASRVVRPPNTEDNAHHAPTTPAHALRGAVRPTAQPSQAQGVAVQAPAPIGGRLGLGQAQRRVISAPTPAQRPPPPVEDTPVPLGRTLQSASEDVFGEIEATAREGKADQEVVAEPTAADDPKQETHDSRATTVDSAPTRIADETGQRGEEEPSASANVPPAQSSQAQPAQEASLPLPSDLVEPSPQHAAAVSPAAAIPLPESPVKVAPATIPVPATAPIATESSAGPSKVSRKPGLPSAARRPAAPPTAAGRSVSGASKSGTTAPILPPVRSTKPRQPPAESRPRFKPTSHANPNLTASTASMSRSASHSTTLSGPTTRQAAPVALNTSAARSAAPSRAPAAEAAKVRNPSKPPGPVATRALAANPATRTVAPPVARVAKAAVPKAVMPAGYSKPTAASAAASRVPSSLTAPTAASARRAADRVVSGSSAQLADANTAKPLTKTVPPPVRKERVKLKAAMPSFQPVRGRTLPGSGPAASAPASATSAPNGSSTAARPVAAGDVVAKKDIVAKVKTMPPPAPPAAEVPLPASPGAKPTEVPLPGSPVVEYRGAFRVKKQSMDLVQMKDEVEEAGLKVVAEREVMAEEGAQADVRARGDEGMADATEAAETRAADVDDHADAEAPGTIGEKVDGEESASPLLQDRELSPSAQRSSVVDSAGYTTHAAPETPAEAHFNGNGAYNDDSEEEEEEPIEDRPAVAPPSRSISQDLLTEQAVVMSNTYQSPEDEEEKDLIEFSASSRKSPPSAGSLPTPQHIEQGRQTPSNGDISAKQQDTASPRIALLEKDRNHTPVDMLKTPAKGGVTSMADKMRGLVIAQQGGDEREDGIDEDMSMKLDE